MNRPRAASEARSTQFHWPGSARSESPAAAVPGSAADEQSRGYWLAAALVVGGLGAWMFWPTIADLVAVWNAEPDYSHGFLVAPFAATMLWMRRKSFPADSTVPGWGGLVLLVVSVAVRYAGARLFLTPLSGWALVIWLAGAVWLVAGRRALLWAMPAVLFLMFMVPVPFRIEQLLSWHLQTATTRISTVLLECLGQPAIAEGHTLHLGQQVLEVEQACSGLRMLMGIAAVAFAFVALQRRPWWEKLTLILAVAPVAMLANSTRVVITGLLMQVVSGEAAVRFSHDAAGWVTIVCAAALFTVLAAYLRRLIVAVEMETGRELLRRPAAL
ncbi:MAG: exosortase/archaeosortase family protein [Planctomycetia bacterium]|nr:exosortase/archaeosortase family protein [Planctomycetia bacterium]